MKRLIEEDSVAGSLSHLLAELVRATPRLEPDDFRKHRVLTKVRYAQRSARPRFRAAVAVVLLASGSAAAATVARLAVVRNRGLPSSTRPLAQAPILPTMPAPTAAVPGGIDVEALPPATTASPSSVVQTRASAKPPRAMARSEAQARIADALPATGAYDSEDAAQVVEAISALRNKGDGVRAGALLAGYLSAHPRGVLGEDALALSIEAAAARHDPVSAADYGALYLQQFPNGRFRAVALRASKMANPSFDRK